MIHQRAYRQRVDGESRRKAARLHVAALFRILIRIRPIRIVREVDQLVQIEVDAGEQVFYRPCRQIHDGRAGHLQHAAAQRAVANGVEVEINVAVDQIYAYHRFPICIGGGYGRRHLNADIGVERGKIFRIAVQHQIEPVFDALRRVYIKVFIVFFRIYAFHVQHFEQSVERIAQIEGFSVAARTQFKGDAAAEHGVYHLVDEVRALVCKTVFHRLRVFTFAARILDQFVAQIGIVLFNARSESGRQREVGFKSGAFIRAAFQILRVVEAEFELIALARRRGQLHFPRQVVEPRKIDDGSILQDLGDGGHCHRQREVGIQHQGGAAFCIARKRLRAVCQSQHRRALLALGQLTQKLFHFFGGDLHDVCQIFHHVKVFHFEHGEFHSQQLDLRKVDIKIAVVNGHINALARIEYGLIVGAARAEHQRRVRVGDNAHHQRALLKIERAFRGLFQIGCQREAELYVRFFYGPSNAVIFDGFQSVLHVLVVHRQNGFQDGSKHRPDVGRAACRGEVEIQAHIQRIEQGDNAVLHL